MPPPPDPALVAAFAQTVRAVGVWFMRVAAEQSGSHATLTKQEMLTLDVLGVRGPSRMGEIADHLGVGQSAVTPLVDRLEAGGLVQRRRSEADRRVWLVGLTEAGGAVFADATAVHERVAEAMLAPLTPEERETLAALFARIAAS